MDYQSLAKLVSNRYGLRFVAIPNHNEGEPTQSLSLKIGAAPFIVLNDEEPVRVDAKCFSFADAIRDLPGFRAPSSTVISSGSALTSVSLAIGPSSTLSITLSRPQ